MTMDPRKQRVLQAIVALYAMEGEPVGSGLLSNYLDLSVSSATLRNEMAALTKLGLLEQPHTSAGRVPKDQRARMRLFLHELNHSRRWYHFYLDKEGGVVAACDAVVTPETAGPVGMELIRRGVYAVDENYPILMKALWSGKE